MPIDVNGDIINAYSAGAIGNKFFPNRGLVLHLDAADPNSYPGTGTTWYDLTGNANFNILATAYNSTGVKYMDFNGSYGCAKKIDSDFPLVGGGNITCIVWTIPLNSSATWRTLMRGLSSGPQHMGMIEYGGWNIGIYDNVNASGFNSSGYSQQSLPGYPTAWNMMIFRWNSSSSPYFSLSLNGTPGTAVGTITSVNSKFIRGICSIGAYHEESQSNPATASQYWGSIAKFMLYNRVLSDAECLQIYNSTKARFGV
jgi:hypothetical protein